MVMRPFIQYVSKLLLIVQIFVLHNIHRNGAMIWPKRHAAFPSSRTPNQRILLMKLRYVLGMKLHANVHTKIGRNATRKMVNLLE